MVFFVYIKEYGAWEQWWLSLVTKTTSAQHSTRHLGRQPTLRNGTLGQTWVRVKRTGIEKKGKLPPALDRSHRSGWRLWRGIPSPASSSLAQSLSESDEVNWIGKGSKIGLAESTCQGTLGTGLPERTTFKETRRRCCVYCIWIEFLKRLED